MQVLGQSLVDMLQALAPSVSQQWLGGQGPSTRLAEGRPATSEEAAALALAPLLSLSLHPKSNDPGLQLLPARPQVQVRSRA